MRKLVRWYYIDRVLQIRVELPLKCHLRPSPQMQFVYHSKLGMQSIRAAQQESSHRLTSESQPAKGSATSPPRTEVHPKRLCLASSHCLDNEFGGRKRRARSRDVEPALVPPVYMFLDTRLNSRRRTWQDPLRWFEFTVCACNATTAKLTASCMCVCASR